MINDILDELLHAILNDANPWDITIYQRAAEEIKQLRDENSILRRNEWRLIWGLCTECGKIREENL